MVCTANMARSPLLALLLQDHADRRLGVGALTVGSAGIAAHSGDPAAPGSRWVAEGWGLSLEHHRARPLRLTPLQDVVLVLTMTRRQQRAVRRAYPEAAPRTFATRELMAVLEAADEPLPLGATTQARSPQDRVRAITKAANDRRPRTRLRSDLDIADPIGGDQEVFRRLGEELSEASKTLAATLFGPDLG